MNERAKERWKKYHNKGKYSFIFKFGGIYIGLLNFVLNWLSLLFFSFLGYDNVFSLSTRGFIELLGANILVAYPIGIVWSWIIWSWFEKNYSHDK